MSSSVGRRVASNTAVQMVGKAAILLIGAASLAVLTRYLGREAYGRFTLALMYMQLFGVLADVGLFTTVVRDISKRPDRTEELVGNTITLRLLLAVVAIALAASISLLLPYSRSVRIAILLAGVPLTFGLLRGSLVAVFQARLRMGRAVIADVVGRAAGFGLTVAVATIDLGFYAVMGAAAGGALVTLGVAYALSRDLVRVRFLADRQTWRRLLVASLPLGLALAINELYFRADTLIISLFRPYGDVGLYTLAYRILEFAIAFGTVFLTTVFPVISRQLAEDEDRVRGTIQASWNVFVLLGAPLVAGGVVLAPQIIHLVAGHSFDGSITPLRVLLVAAALSWVNGVFGYALIAKERQATALWLNVTALIVNVGLNLALVPAYGIVAAAVVTVASEILILAASRPLMRQHLGFFPRPGTLGAAVVAASAMAAVLWPLRHGPLAALLPLGVVLYMGLVYAISPTSRAALAGLRGQA